MSVENQNQDPTQNLAQLQPVTVIVLDENDNPPTFKNVSIFSKTDTYNLDS